MIFSLRSPKTLSHYEVSFLLILSLINIKLTFLLKIYMPVLSSSWPFHYFFITLHMHILFSVLENGGSACLNPVWNETCFLPRRSILEVFPLILSEQCFLWQNDVDFQSRFQLTSLNIQLKNSGCKISNKIIYIVIKIYRKEQRNCC